MPNDSIFLFLFTIYYYFLLFLTILFLYCKHATVKLSLYFLRVLSDSEMQDTGFIAQTHSCRLLTVPNQSPVLASSSECLRPRAESRAAVKKLSKNITQLEHIQFLLNLLFNKELQWGLIACMVCTHCPWDERCPNLKSLSPDNHSLLTNRKANRRMTFGFPLFWREIVFEIKTPSIHAKQRSAFGGIPYTNAHK
jgi:hypothetical protein